MKAIYTIFLVFCSILGLSISEQAIAEDSDLPGNKTNKPSIVNYEPVKIVKSSDGYYYLGINTFSFSDGQGYRVLKVNSDGEIKWIREFESQNQEEIVDIIASEKGGIIILGNLFEYKPSTGYRTWIKYLNIEGKQIFYKLIGNNWRGKFLMDFSKSSLLIVGETKNEKNSDNIDVGWTKLDSKLNLLWEQSCDMGNDESVFAAAINSSSETIYLALNSGQTNKFGQGESDGFILKLDADGNVSTKVELPEYLTTISGNILCKNDEVTITYLTSSQLDDCPSATISPKFYYSIRSFTGDLMEVWVKNFEYTSIQGPTVKRLNDNNLLIAGSVSNGIMLRKISEKGKLIWENSFSIDKLMPHIFDNVFFEINDNFALILFGVIDLDRSAENMRINLMKVDTTTGLKVWQKEL